MEVKMRTLKLLTRVCSSPSKRMLKKAIRFAHAYGQSLHIYAEDYRRSEEHTFVDFLLPSQESRMRYDDYFMQWCKSILELVKDIRTETELPAIEVDFELLNGTHWEKRLCHIHAEGGDTFLVDYSRGLIASQLLRELTRKGCHVLLLTEKKWGQEFKIAAAIDPLHRGDRKAEIDKTIIANSIELKRNFEADVTIVYCQFVAPYLYRYSQEILKHQKHAIKDFLETNNFHHLSLRLVNANPEEGLPSCVNSIGASILVMGACKRSILSRYWSGSTVDVLLKQAPCDILLISK
ncbi:universal stress protein (plasmid) [Vibrio nigripulchritudo]|nr:universal stress protein [Vibrio nigripulchritudo]BDU35197.1 universal stress protein [Vibrio nigripulchritudo]